MADSTLRFSPPNPSDFIFPTLSTPCTWRSRNPRFLPYSLHLLHNCSFSHTTTFVLFGLPEKITRPTRRRFGYRNGAASSSSDEKNYARNDGRREKSKTRRRKRRLLWEELLEDYNDYDEDDDDGGGGGGGGVAGIFDQVIDNVWIFKVFKSYGYLLPFIILSFILTTGPKAFLTALAVAATPSLLFQSFQKLTGGDKRRRKPRTSLRSEEEVEGKSRKTGVGYYPSRVRSNDSPAETGSVYSNASSEHSRRGKTSSFGGWDELDGLGPIPEPSPATNESARKPAENGKKFPTKRVTRERAEPLLLRSLFSLFPFLNSRL